MTDQNLPENDKAVPVTPSAAPANQPAAPSNQPTPPATDPAVPATDPAPKKAEISMGRIAIWVCVTGVALYLIISGVVGIVAKGS